MIFNYTPLLKTLFNKGITRKQLREVLQLSPATMARINANEPIAMETIGRICDFLQCNLDKVLSIEPEKEPPARWASLTVTPGNGNHQTFWIYMYFLLDSDTVGAAQYIYGYAMPFDHEKSGPDALRLTYGKNSYKQFCTVNGILSRSQLIQFLDAASKQHDLRDICKLIKINITDAKKTDVDKIYNARIANGQLVYRPPFILPPDNSYLDCQPRFKPLLSYEEDATLCESLYGVNKRQYYTTQNGIDSEKVKLLWAYLSDSLPLHHNLNEISRLGNFEVLTYLHDSSYAPVKCEIWRKGDKQLGAKLTLHSKLNGKYILRTRLYNRRNPIMDSAFLIDAQNKEENPLYIPLNEDFYFSEVELWTIMGTNQSGQRLIYQSSTPYIRQIALNISVQERSIKLEDRWSQAMKKKGQAVNTQISFFSNEKNPPVIGRQDDLWIAEEKLIQDDFHTILGAGNELHYNDAFFPKGKDKIVEFLVWLNKRLEERPQATRVLLFDPYINGDAIINFMRNIKYINVAYDIFTDSCPAGIKERTEIKNLKTLSSALPHIVPTCKLTVHTFTKSSGTLHDRLLMIADNTSTIVYVLSNSFDSMAKQHSSIVTAVNPKVATEIFNTYAQLVQNAEQKKTIEKLYDSHNPAPTITVPAESYTKENNYTKNDFMRDYITNAKIKTALHNLAFMSYNEKLECFNYVLNLEKERETNRLEKVLNDAINEKLPAITKEKSVYVQSQNVLVKQPFDVAGRLIESASNSIGWCFEYRSILPYAYSYAIKILWGLAPEHFVSFLENLVKKQSDGNKSDAINIIPTPLDELIYSMVAHITKALACLKSEMKQPSLQILAKSNIAYLRALFAARSIWFTDEFLNNLRKDDDDTYKKLMCALKDFCSIICTNLNQAEASATLIHLIENLQVEICRHKQSQVRIQSLIDVIITVYVNITSTNKKSDTNYLIQQFAPLNMRNPADICQIAEKLQKAKYINAEQSYEILLHYWNLIYTKENGRERDFYNEDTIQRSILLANAIMKTGIMHTESLLREIAKKSRNLCSRLNDPLLYNKDYCTWKNTVDQLSCLFVTQRFINRQYNSDSSFILSKSEEELQKLTKNCEEILDKYSVTYRLWKAVAARMVCPQSDKN